MILKKAIITLFVTFSSIFLFIYLVRLNMDKHGFLGFNDLFSYFETVDFGKPIDRLSNSIQTLSKSWNLNSTDGLTTTNGVLVNGTFSQVWNQLPAAKNPDLNVFESKTIKYLNAILETIIFPFKLIGNFVLIVADYCSMFVSFLSFIISSDGYTATTSVI